MIIIFSGEAKISIDNKMKNTILILVDKFYFTGPFVRRTVISIMKYELCVLTPVLALMYVVNVCPKVPPIPYMDCKPEQPQGDNQ